MYTNTQIAQIRSLLKLRSEGGTHLDAERCAALEELLYVAQALAVVLRLLVDLHKKKKRKTTQAELVRGSQARHTAHTAALRVFLGPGVKISTRILQSVSPDCELALPLRARLSPGGWTRAGVSGRGK